MMKTREDEGEEEEEGEVKVLLSVDQGESEVCLHA